MINIYFMTLAICAFFWIDSRTAINLGAAGSSKEESVVLGAVASGLVETIEEPINADTDVRHDEDSPVPHATMV